LKDVEEEKPDMLITIPLFMESKLGNLILMLILKEELLLLVTMRKMKLFSKILD